jgi:hypothetical protein
MLSIYTLEEGVVYVVTRPFEDYYQGSFAADTKLTYVGRAFLPYDGGHTLFFKEGNVYLQEDADAALIASLHEHLKTFDASGRVDPALRPAPVSMPRARRKGFYYFVGFFLLAMLSLLILFFGSPRPMWLAFIPFGIGLLLIIAAVFVEWGQPPL